jgi:hypothetical protein
VQKLNRRFVVGAVGLLLLALSTTAEAGTLTLAWDPPSTGTLPQGYAIAWGFQSGAYTDYVDVGLATSHTFTDLIDGQTYFFAAFGYAAGVPSAPSNELRFGGCSAAPGAPTNLSANVANTLVTLGWQPPSGETPAGYRVQVGSRTGLTDLANLLVTTTSLTGTVTAGTYYVRVLGVNQCGDGPASTEVAVTVGSPGGPGKKAPGAPRNPKKQVFSSAVTLSWDPPATGDAPERYVLEVSDNHGRSANVDTGNPGTSISGHVPPGTYHVKIRAANSGGMGPATSVITIVVTP